jgi:hypothetical protein
MLDEHGDASDCQLSAPQPEQVDAVFGEQCGFDGVRVFVE